jgi:NAD(P)H-hydrate epimerase
MKINNLFISIKQMRKIDAITSSKYKISSLILMENAGRQAAQIVKDNVKSLANKNIAIVCGSGNNAGDGFVAARYLINSGASVKIILIKPHKNLKGDAKINFEILKKLKVDISANQEYILKADIIIDAMLGAGLKGIVSDAFKKAIEKINNSKAIIFSIDMPSGIDGNTGDILGAAIKADITIAIAMLKNAFKKKIKNFGKVIIADIGIPLAAIKDILKI